MCPMQVFAPQRVAKISQCGKEKQWHGQERKGSFFKGQLNKY